MKSAEANFDDAFGQFYSYSQQVLFAIYKKKINSVLKREVL